MRQNLLVAMFLFFGLSLAHGQDWSTAQQSKEATLDVYWYTSRPFIYQNTAGEFEGVEFEILQAFQDYLKNTHGLNLTLNWKKAENFSNVMEVVREADRANVIGVSAFSITEERKQFLDFTQSYLTDISVLVSSKGTPIVRSTDEISAMMNNMQAVTIRGTVYEKMLKDLQVRLGREFEIVYISSGQNILDVINEEDNRFGFIDLPIYLMQVKRGGELTRQNFFTVRGTGYGFILPQGSDWVIPFNAFLTDEESKKTFQPFISKYMGAELYSFIDELYSEEQLSTSILTKEKELQLALIKNANLRLAEEERSHRILVIGLSAVGVLLLAMSVLLIKYDKTMRQMTLQKGQIEEQQKDIQHKNEKLINRNVQLHALNEDKNHLVSILAHDLRSPLSQIVGLSNLMSSSSKRTPEEDATYLGHIHDAAERMNQMVSKILDREVLEGTQSPVLVERVDVRQVIGDIADRYGSVAQQKSICLETVLSSDSWLMTDHMLLFLVLENLVSNAIKFSPQGSVVGLEASQHEGRMIFVVRDQGPGFSEEDKSRMFHRFQKLSAQPTGNESSTGLGLSIVKKYVQDLQGKIWLESQPEEGSVFYVSLPIEPQES
ncbi:hypothetical protein BFP72_05150 [Reichenbachiella sp. 5M10]|uniref:ATP-binding protein n=1 Tax=Reichenbachiella sp. 5M10 TaxID=1889772 RepID=UPI000C146087|nr:ATP-binding protein [Reichenbachiella sp. 5M10]PIB34833.1 hypothetical protein BFP72_05150 [Reichenbachiella sp. 5M10]